MIGMSRRRNERREGKKMARRKEGQVTAGAVGPKTREDSSVWLCLTRSAFMPSSTSYTRCSLSLPLSPIDCFLGQCAVPLTPNPFLLAFADNIPSMLHSPGLPLTSLVVAIARWPDLGSDPYLAKKSRELCGCTATRLRNAQ